MGNELLIYGSYGYTGKLITEEAIERGLSPVLAGRRAEQVERQATELELDHRVFSLEHPAIVRRHVEAADVVLNCAGPFSKTAEPLITACVQTGTDYLDITGEIDVLEGIAEHDREAEKADVTLLPAVGFDVVPSDCLAVYLDAKLPSATRLTLAMDGLGTFSPGTIQSIIEGLSRSGAVREDGIIRTVPAAWKTRRFDFGQGPKLAVTVPWGDISTAYYGTGIPNIETYATVPEYAATMMRKTRSLLPVLGTKPAQRLLKAVADKVVSGPTETERAQSITRICGEVEADEGTRAVARLQTPDTYDVTARTAAEAARRTLDGEVGSGFQTPASAFGADFVLEFEGVVREDVVETHGRVRASE